MNEKLEAVILDVLVKKTQLSTDAMDELAPAIAEAVLEYAEDCNRFLNEDLKLLLKSARDETARWAYKAGAVSAIASKYGGQAAVKEIEELLKGSNG